jgi:hypothetical protein
VRSLLAPRWLARHALALVLVGGCLLLMVWQLRRATGGNTLSWAYVAEWPLFAAFVVWMWVRAMRDDLSRARGEDPYAGSRPPPIKAPPPRRVTVPPGAAPGAGPAEEDPQLAEYNRYLAWLAADPDRKPGDYPREQTG